MSENKIPANNSQNSEIYQEIANRFYKNGCCKRNKINSIIDLVEFVIEQHFGDINLFGVKTDSEIQLEVEAEVCSTESNDDLWIFGYGSLVWKADFPYISRHIGHIRGFNRRFYQNSIDHRGTKENPGRVVTLVPSADPSSKVYGVAYRIASSDKDNVLKHLDYREKNGYERFSVNFFPYNSNQTDDQKSEEYCREILMYIATEVNESYAGHIDNLDEIVTQIYAAIGPSGTNREYLYKLANAMRFLFPGEIDEHLFALEGKLRQREQKELEAAEKIRQNLTIILKKSIDSNLSVDEIIELVQAEFLNEVH